MNQKATDSAFLELLERNYPRWFGIARAYARDADRDDLLQEILLQEWKSLPRFAEQSHIDTWAYRVALNTALAWDRSNKNRHRRLPQETADVSQLTAQQNTPQQETKILDEFLQSLSKVDRAVLLVHLDGLANDEAAEITGLTEGTYRVRLHRLKKKFQETYCDQEDDS